MQALFEYGGRYAAIVDAAGLGFRAPDDPSALVVVERLPGNAATDFGAPAIAPAADGRALEADDLNRFIALLEACWSAFDRATAAAAGKELRLGPRGGGRTLEGIVRHVLDGQDGYLGQLGWKAPRLEAAGLEEKALRSRQAILEALAAGEPLAGGTARRPALDTALFCAAGSLACAGSCLGNRGQGYRVNLPSKTEPTPYPDLNGVLQVLRESAQTVLGETFTAAWLQGSFAVGDFDLHSDVDFIIGVEDELSDAQVESLQAMHARIFELDCAWAQHLEGSYFPRQLLRRPTGGGEKLWYLDNGSRALIQSEHDNSLVVRWVLREHGVSLAGPDARTLIDPIEANDLRREILGVIIDWGTEILAHPERYNNRFYQGFIVLSYCRMLHDLQAGSVGSKRSGAEWAQSWLGPSWTRLVDRSWSGRPNPEISVRTPADPEEFAATLEFVQYMIQAGQQAAANLHLYR